MSVDVLSLRHAKYIAGLDIGQMSDPSALTVLDRDLFTDKGAFRYRYAARWLERFPLQTPYPTMARMVRERLEKLGERLILVIDVTGVGRGVVDTFREEWMTVDPVTYDRVPQPGKPLIVALTLLTSAMYQPTSPSWDEHHVPKKDVVLALMLALQHRRFRVPRQLKEAAVLFKEGQNFQWKATPNGNDQYDTWRSGQHDDLLLAVAIAVWWGEQYGRLASLRGGQVHYATPAASPHQNRHAARPAVASGGWGRR